MTFIAKAPKIDVRRLRKKKSYEAEEVLRRLNAFLDKNFEEPMKILRHFWKDQQDAMTYAELREAIKTGHLSDYTARSWRYDYAKLVNDHLSHTWRNALALGPSGQPSMDNLTSFRLDMQKPGVLNWIGARAADFVTNEVQEQKDAIRSVLMRGVTNQHTVDEMARVIRPLVGLNKPQTIANYNYYNHMVKTLTEQHPRTSAASIQARAQEAAVKYAEKQHRARAMMIARTELSFAYNRGAYEGVKQAQDLGLMGAVVKIWSTSQGGNVCPECEALEGEEVGMDAPFFESRGLFKGDNLVPPLHPRCYCAIVYQEVATRGVGGLKPAYSYDEYDILDNGFSFENEDGQTNSDKYSLSRIYVNRSDRISDFMSRVKPIDGFEDFGAHGTPNSLIYETTSGEITEINARDFAKTLKEDPEYKGGNIRLLACHTGAENKGFAKQLAELLGVTVRAPTEDLWINEKGEMFISNSEVLADIWYNNHSVNPTGKWKDFKPDKR